MPIVPSRLLVSAALCAAALSILAGAQVARAKSTPAELRVVTGDGKSLVDVTQFTGTTRIPTSPRARCFFGGVGGSGEPASLMGPNALGLVADAARNRRRLRPLRITDEFSFGLGVCGIGGANANANRYWTVRVNHRSIQVGADQYTLRPASRVLWALIPNPVCEQVPPYACEAGPPELELRAPARARPGQEIRVRAVEWSESGRRSPAAGATVTGAASPTDAAGATLVTLERTRKLVARRAGAIASAELGVCVSAEPGRCPRRRGRILIGSGRGETIRGTAGGDRIEPGGGADRVRAGGGSDLIRARGGGRDRIDCGGGRDLVIADRRDAVARNCERVRRR
jgi:hypothetical protein